MTCNCSLQKTRHKYNYLVIYLLEEKKYSKLVHGFIYFEENPFNSSLTLGAPFNIEKGSLGPL